MTLPPGGGKPPTAKKLFLEKKGDYKAKKPHALGLDTRRCVAGIAAVFQKAATLQTGPAPT